MNYDGVMPGICKKVGMGVHRREHKKECKWQDILDGMSQGGLSGRQSWAWVCIEGTQGGMQMGGYYGRGMSQGGIPKEGNIKSGGTKTIR